MDDLFKKLRYPVKRKPHKMINTLKQFVGNSRQIVRECLTILWCWRLKGYITELFRGRSEYKHIRESKQTLNFNLEIV